MSRPGDVVLLSGPLGAGKTCLTQGIAKALGVHEDTASPSYVLLRELFGRIPLYHLDLYRLEFNEISELGLDDYLYGHGLCVIEWAEKGQPIMPKQHLQLILSYGAGTTRLIKITPCGEHYIHMAEHISHLSTSYNKKGMA
jgi:tRNA threonylcarbamoyladenosine biosynthesis protein TsaE